MDKKGTYLANRLSLKFKPPKGLPKISPVYIDPLRRSQFTERVNLVNPFDSLIDNRKSNPTLPPVLNKHRKQPSVPAIRTLLTDRTSSDSLKVQRSEISLPKIFKQKIVKIQKPKGCLFRYLTVTENAKDLDNLTPSFSYEKSKGCSERRTFNQELYNEKIEVCGNLAEKSTEDLVEISFGDFMVA